MKSKGYNHVISVIVMWGCYYQHPDKLDGGLRHYDTQKHEKVTLGELPIDAFIFVRDN